MGRRAWVLLLTLGVIWGMPYMLIRVAVTDLDPVLVAWGRTAIGALVLLPVAVRRRELTEAARHWRAVLLYAGVEIIGPWVLLGHAETRVSSATAGLFIAVVPALSAALAAALGQERLTVRRGVGLAVGLAGVFAIVGTDITADTWAFAALFGAAVGYAIGPVVMVRRLGAAPAMGVITLSLAFAAATYTPFVPSVWPSNVSSASVLAVVVLGVACTALAFVLFFRLVAEAGPARSTLVTYLNPVVAVALGSTVLAEPFTTGMAVGFPLVIVGSVLASSRGGRELPALPLNAGPTAPSARQAASKMP